MEDTTYSRINEDKASFDDIYSEPDPRSYFRVLGGLDYTIPDLARPIFHQIVGARAKDQERPVTILDLGCSYGINAALLRLPLKFETLRRRYMMPEIQALPSPKLLGIDRHYFRSWPAQDDLEIIGLDVSNEAVNYAADVGILDSGLCEDLENEEPSMDARRALRNVDVVISTGCVGYVTEKTFERILECNENPEPPWIVSFVLRMFPYDAVAATLGRFGLETEKFEGATFVQRRFSDAKEFDYTLTTLERLGIDSEGHEAEGLYHAELFVSRPGVEIESQPLGNLISIVSGGHRRYGRRYYRIPGVGKKLLQT